MPRNVYWLNESIESISGTLFASIVASLCVALLLFAAKKKRLAAILLASGLVSHLFFVSNNSRSTAETGGDNHSIISINPPNWLMLDPRVEFIRYKEAEKEGIAGQWNKPLFLKSLCDSSNSTASYKKFILMDWDVVVYDRRNFFRGVWSVASPATVLYNGRINSGITSWTLPRDCDTVYHWANYRNILPPKLRDSYLADQLYLESNYSGTRFTAINAGFHRHCTSANVFRATCIDRGVFVPVSIKALLHPTEVVIVVICSLLLFLLLKSVETIRQYSIVRSDICQYIQVSARNLSPFLSVGAAVLAVEGNTVWARRKKSVVELVISIFLLLQLDISLKTLLFGKRDTQKASSTNPQHTSKLYSVVRQS